LTINIKPEQLKPVDVYLKMQGRFSHLTKEDIAAIQKDVEEARIQLLAWEKSGLNMPVATG
jgi:pyruvate/2-oxoacid:ferredoxin oxidoreductase beta subunit